MDKSPLVAAMQPRMEGSPRPNLPPPRFFTFDASELPSGIKPGDEVTGYISGVIKSMDDEGNVVVNITDFRKDRQVKKPETIFVTTQESHSP